MKGVSRAATVAALLLPVAGAPLAAQSWKADLGVNGGGSWYSPLLGADQINNGNGDVRFRGSWLAGAQASYWLLSWVGIRANGTYTDTPLKQGNGFLATDTELWRDINLWSGTGDLMFRLRRPGATFTRWETLPYLALGAGAKWIAPAGTGKFFAANNLNGGAFIAGIPFMCGPNGFCGGPGTPFTALGIAAPAGIVGVNTGSNAIIAGAPAFFLPSQTRFMGLVGLGADTRLAPQWGIRYEIGDRIYKPRIYAVAPGTLFPGGTVETLNGTTTVSKTVHEVYAQLGIHYLMGLAKPPVVAVVPAPPPPPPPPPALETVGVCTVTPTGLTTTMATYNPATGDTTVVVNGQVTPLAQAFTNVPLVSNATWYVQGQPLVIGSGENELNYISYGSGRAINMNDLTFVGTAGGLPVFVSNSDAVNLTIPATPIEISTDPTLMGQLRSIQVLYVPLTVTGPSATECNFQPLQMQQAVRKVRG